MHRAAIALMAVSLFIGPAAYAEEGSRLVRVGVYDNRPKIYRDTDGTIQGFWADITNEIAAREGWRIEYVHDTWDRNLARLASGQIDLMVDVAVSEAREDAYDFNTETALLSWGLFYTREGVSLESVADLQGKRIAVLTSGILYTGPLGLKDILLTSGIEADIIDVAVYEDVFALLDSGDADVGVVSWYFGFANENRYKVRRTGIIFRPSELKYALPRGAPGNSELISAIDADLRQMKGDPSSVYHQSIRRHFGPFLEKQPTLPAWARYLLGALGALSTMALVGVLTQRRYKRALERQVREQTGVILENSRQLSIVYDNVADVIFLIAVESPGRYRFTRVNAAFERTTGIPEDQVVGKLVTDVIPPVSHELVLGNYERAIRERRSTQWSETSEYPRGTKYGEVTVTPIFDGERCVALVGTVHDITEKRRQEELLRESANRIAELQRAKTEFMSVAAHQLKSPVATVLYSIETIKDGPTTATQQEAIRAVEKGAGEMNEIVNFLMKITRAESGRLQFELAAVDLKEVTESVQEILEGELNAKHQRVEVTQNPFPFKDSAEFPAVVMDREALKQVILNIVTNAHKYSPDNAVIRVSMSIRDASVVYSVSDSGIGIPKEAQARVFEKLFRADNARALVPEGTGLGLALVRALVEAWGGTVWFESEEGKGTTFSFTIPMVGISGGGKK